MKRTISIFAIFSVLTLSIIYSCRSGENETSEVITATGSLYNKKESTLLQKKYGFISVSNYVNKTDETIFNNIKSSTSFSKNTFSAEDLDLTKVTETIWDDGAISYTIIFKNNTSKFLVVSVKKNENFDVNNGVIIENLVDNHGNGEMNYTNIEGETKQYFENGKEVNSTLVYGRRPFRECFDQAYNDVCDGFIGCVAWYSNPGVPLAAAAYCQIHG